MTHHKQYDPSRCGVRWLYLAVGTVALAFAGIIYAWSILKAPLAEEFHWSSAALAVNFTLTMSFFSVGCMVGGLLCRKIGFKPTVLLAAVLGFLGFFLTSRMSGEHILTLYLSYGVMAGLGIGMAYNSLISAANRWFPDKPGFCSGCLMMGFGLSTLILGTLAERLMAQPGLLGAVSLPGVPDHGGQRHAVLCPGCVFVGGDGRCRRHRPGGGALRL
jgi:OFA family oxalate/formate antiporter-like MFS transporter